MERFWKKKKFAEYNFAGKLCPRIQKKLDAAKIKSMSCQAIPNVAMSFEVRFDDKQMVVDLNKHTCTCRKWDLTGIPCYHAVSCIYFLHQFPEIYVDECYEVTKYISAYGFNVSPVVGHESWLPSIRGPILPPHVVLDTKAKRGRRKTKRMKGPEENSDRSSQRRKYKETNGRVSRRGEKQRCSVCRKTGHNKSHHKKEQSSCTTDIETIHENSHIASTPIDERGENRPAESAATSYVLQWGLDGNSQIHPHSAVGRPKPYKPLRGKGGSVGQTE